MASVFLGINDRTFTYSFTAGRSEFQGTGFRTPMDFALGPDDLVYIVNRSGRERDIIASRVGSLSRNIF